MTEDQTDYKPVYIMGAGASMMAGMPLLTDFMKKARELRYGNQLDEHMKSEYSKVFEYQQELFATRQVTSIDLDNLEALFSVIDMDWQTSTSEKIDLHGVREALISIIIKTLQLSYAQSILYSAIIAHLAEPINSSFVTFNYDLCLEQALAEPFARNSPSFARIDYCFDKFYQPMSYKRTIPVIKLHGSANWIWCPTCEQVHTLPDYTTPGMITQKAPHKGPGISPQCEGTFLNLILPPTWNKTNYAQTITGLWKRSIQEISLATHLFIIGYSFPRTDVFFEQLLTLAMKNSKNLKYVYIINPDRQMEKKLLPKLFDQHFLNRSVKFYPIRLKDLAVSGLLRPGEDKKWSFMNRHVLETAMHELSTRAPGRDWEIADFFF